MKRKLRYVVISSRKRYGQPKPGTSMGWMSGIASLNEASFLRDKGNGKQRIHWLMLCRNVGEGVDSGGEKSSVKSAGSEVAMRPSAPCVRSKA